MNTTREPKTPTVDQLAREHLGEIDLVAKSSHYRLIIDTVGVVADIKPTALLGSDDIMAKALAHTRGIHNIPVNFPAGAGIVISKDPVLAEYLRSLLTTSQTLSDDGLASDDQDREIGRILGYPKTATNYFIERSRYRQRHGCYPNEDWREQIPSFHRYVAGFTFSPRHWPEEINEYSAKIAEVMRIYTPETYREIVDTTVGQSAVKEFISLDQIHRSNKALHSARNFDAQDI